MKYPWQHLFAKLPKHFWCVINFCWPDSGNCQLGEDDHQLRLGLETNSCMCSAYRWSYWKLGTTDESSKNDASFIVSQISGWSKSKNPIWIPNDIKSWLLKLDIENLWRIKKRLKVGNLENQNLRPYCFFALGFVPLILVDDGPPLLPLMVL